MKPRIWNGGKPMCQELEEYVRSKEFKEALARQVAEDLDNWFVNTPEGSYVFLEMMGYDMDSEPDFRGCFGSKTIRVEGKSDEVKT